MSQLVCSICQSQKEVDSNASEGMGIVGIHSTNSILDNSQLGRDLRYYKQTGNMLASFSLLVGDWHSDCIS